MFSLCLDCKWFQRCVRFCRFNRNRSQDCLRNDVALEMKVKGRSNLLSRECLVDFFFPLNLSKRAIIGTLRSHICAGVCKQKPGKANFKFYLNRSGGSSAPLRSTGQLSTVVFSNHKRRLFVPCGKLAQMPVARKEKFLGL